MGTSLLKTIAWQFGLNVPRMPWFSGILQSFGGTNNQKTFYSLHSGILAESWEESNSSTRIDLSFMPFWIDCFGLSSREWVCVFLSLNPYCLLVCNKYWLGELTILIHYLLYPSKTNWIRGQWGKVTYVILSIFFLKKKGSNPFTLSLESRSSDSKSYTFFLLSFVLSVASWIKILKCLFRDIGSGQYIRNEPPQPSSVC